MAGKFKNLYENLYKEHENRWMKTPKEVGVGPELSRNEARAIESAVGKMYPPKIMLKRNDYVEYRDLLLNFICMAQALKDDDWEGKMINKEKCEEIIVLALTEISRMGEKYGYPRINPDDYDEWINLFCEDERVIEQARTFVYINYDYSAHDDKALPSKTTYLEDPEDVPGTGCFNFYEILDLRSGKTSVRKGATDVPMIYPLLHIYCFSLFCMRERTSEAKE